MRNEDALIAELNDDANRDLRDSSKATVTNRESTQNKQEAPDGTSGVNKPQHGDALDVNRSEAPSVPPRASVNQESSTQNVHNQRDESSRHQPGPKEYDSQHVQPERQEQRERP